MALFHVIACLLVIYKAYNIAASDNNTICEKPASITNGDVGYHVDDPLLAIYTCHSGYTLNGKAYRTCNSSGKWEGNVPTCDLAYKIAASDNNTKCEKPVSISNGDVGYHVDDPLLAIYTCHSGYTLKGKARRTCNSNGEWEGNVPSCHLECKKPASISNGDVGYHVDDPLLAVYTCHSGYTLKGKSDITCNSNGEWEGNVPSCDSEDKEKESDVDLTLVIIISIIGLIVIAAIIVFAIKRQDGHRCISMDHNDRSVRYKVEIPPSDVNRPEVQTFLDNALKRDTSDYKLSIKEMEE